MRGTLDKFGPAEGPLTRIALQSDLTPQAGRGKPNVASIQFKAIMKREDSAFVRISSRCCEATPVRRSGAGDCWMRKAWWKNANPRWFRAWLRRADRHDFHWPMSSCSICCRTTFFAPRSSAALKLPCLKFPYGFGASSAGRSPRFSGSGWSPSIATTASRALPASSACCAIRSRHSEMIRSASCMILSCLKRSS